MAIGRMQMNRQLYGLGGYFPPENGREKFGLGSKLKKFVRKIIPNEVSEIAVKAAPFVAPFNPLLAGYMAGIGGFDQTGRIGSSLKSGLLTYGGGQLGRYIGGAGFQQGFNPFAGYNPASSFGGISSLFTSPIGTQTGLQLGQYEMFGGPGSKGFKASQVTDPGIARDSIFAQPGAEGTFTYSDMGDDIINLSPGSITPTGQIVSGTPVQNQLVLDQLAKQSAVTTGSGEVAKQASRGYTDLLKSVVSPDSTLIERGQAVMDLGGKALKDIYTNKDGDLDKPAFIATLSMIPTYLDAKKAADDAGIEGFDEATYNAERDKYMERYKANLPESSFGIQAAANGGRIGYGDGTKPSAEENTPSQEIINRRIAQIKDMSKRGADIDTIKSITGASDQMIKDVLGQANGGRIGYKQGTPREGIVSLTDEDSGVIYRDPDTEEPITKEEFLRRTQEDEDRQYMSPTDQGSGVIYRNEKGEPITKNEWLRLTSEAPSITLPEKKAKGGRMGYAMGSEVPVRRNEGGITELDYRNTGGFVPIGVKEKADDVPAMLSKNEFVFTADAVRAAGGGSVQKGAQKMYNTMKMLEGKLV
jgi:hypothetical protein